MNKQTKNDFRGAGRVAFLARKESIKKMMAEGYPLKFIYTKYEDELSISYSQFSRYVKRYLGSPRHENENQAISATPERPVETSIEPPAKKFNKAIEKPADDKESGKAFRDDAHERAANDEDLF